MRTVPCVLNGKPVLSSVRIPVLSPRGEILHHYLPLPPSVSLEQIARDAHAGFLLWSARPVADRAAILRDAAHLVAANHAEYVDRHMELGGARAFAEVCARGAADGLLLAALALARAPGTVTHAAAAPLALALRTPVGPVLSLAPWNAPTVLWARALAAPLAAGCSVIAKATEKAPLVAYLYVQHLLAAGVDPQAVQLVHFAPQHQKRATESLISLKYVRKVNFTGSTAVGAEVAAAAARSVTPVLLELGGKNVSVVRADADVDRAAFLAVLLAWMHQGQICMCLDNVYVHESVYPQFVDRIKVHAAALAPTPDMAIGLRDEAGAEKVRLLVADAQARGATVVYPAGAAGENAAAARDLRPDGGAWVVPPLVVENVPHDAPLATDETFGPVLLVFRYSDTDEVVERVNLLAYGLKAAVWSANVVEALALARRLDFGAVHINGSTVHDEATVPHGGVKASGYGRFNAEWGVDEFSYTKVVTIDQ